MRVGHPGASEVSSCRPRKLRATSALVALCDPEVIILGGEWGTHPAVIGAVQARFGQAPRHVPVRPAAVTEEPALSGARNRALRDLRTAIVALARAE